MAVQQTDRQFWSIQFGVVSFVILQSVAFGVGAEETPPTAPTPTEVTSPSETAPPQVVNDDSASNPPPTAEPVGEPLSPPPETTPAPENSPAVLPPAIPVPLSSAPAAETVSVAPPVGQKRVGFAVELSFNVDKPFFAFDDDLIDFSTISGGLFLGGKIGRVIVGMGFELSRLKYRSTRDSVYYYGYESDGDYESSTTTFLFKPGVRFDLVQSKDKKVDLFGQVDLGAGSLIQKDDDEYDYEEANRKYLLMKWDVALGVRYWAHPQFAVSASGGLLGTYLRVRYTEDDSQYSDHLMGISGAIGLVGVF